MTSHSVKAVVIGLFLGATLAGCQPPVDDATGTAASLSNGKGGAQDGNGDANASGGGDKSNNPKSPSPGPTPSLTPDDPWSYDCSALSEADYTADGHWVSPHIDDAAINQVNPGRNAGHVVLQYGEDCAYRVRWVTTAGAGQDYFLSVYDGRFL